jgi:transposase
MYYRWPKAFLDAGKNGLTRDAQRDATTDEVRALKDENATLKKALAEPVLDTMRYKNTDWRRDEECTSCLYYFVVRLCNSF